MFRAALVFAIAALPALPAAARAAATPLPATLTPLPATGAAKPGSADFPVGAPPRTPLPATSATKPALPPGHAASPPPAAPAPAAETAAAGAPALWYERPAAAWLEALPVGNGRLGAMVYGGTATEQIQLNENTLWSGRPGDYDRAGAHRHLPEIRRMLFGRDYKGAAALVARELLGGRPPGAYQSLGDLRLDFDFAPPGEVSDYRRELDLDAAVARVAFRAGGVTHTREVFASAPHQAIVVRLACDRSGALSFSARLDREEGADGAPDGADAFELRGQADRGKPTAGTAFTARLKILAEGGAVRTDGGRLRVTAATAATLIITAATDYGATAAAVAGTTTATDDATTTADADAPRTRSLTQNAADADDAVAAPRARSLAHSAAAAAIPYARLRAAHTADFQALFRRVSLRLGEEEPAGAAAAAPPPTDRRIERARGAASSDPALAALHFHYGRYLLISSSRAGGLPANLQGIWNDRLDPPWFSGWHFDINAQMNYWPANAAALDECHEPLFDLIDRLRANGRKTARDVYGCRGFVVSHRTNAWLFTSPVRGLAIWPVGAGWLCQHYWTHYEFTRDEAFLRGRAWPAMREAAEFFLDWLVPGPDAAGLLVSGPSISPENAFTTAGGGFASLDMGPAMDRQIVAELFDHCLAAAKILGIDDAFTAEVAAARRRLAPTQIGADGRILEWSTERPEREPGHRHVSHLYAVYPGDAITPRATPELAEAARKSLLARAAAATAATADAGTISNISNNSSTGWSLAWNAALWARLGDAARARDALDGLLRRCTAPNLMDTHPSRGTPGGVFQIDGNLGATAAVAELLLQSHEGEIALLPALPAGWASGGFSGLRARGGFTVAAAWRRGVLREARITAAAAGPCAVRAPAPVSVFAGAARVAQSHPADSGDGTHLVRFEAAAGATYHLQTE
jgi:alpha-L-fucosidase 2